MVVVRRRYTSCSGEAKAPPGPFRTTASSLCTRRDACARIRRYRRRRRCSPVFAGARALRYQEKRQPRPTTNVPRNGLWPARTTIRVRAAGGGGGYGTTSHRRAAGEARPTVSVPSRRPPPPTPLVAAHPTGCTIRQRCVDNRRAADAARETPLPPPPPTLGTSEIQLLLLLLLVITHCPSRAVLSVLLIINRNYYYFYVSHCGKIIFNVDIMCTITSITRIVQYYFDHYPVRILLRLTSPKTNSR